MLDGFTPPYTPTGSSSLLPAPPWHFAGRVLSIEVELDARTADRFLPDRFGEATGRGFAHFCDWQATTDGSELLDPIYSQYKEFFFLLEADYDSEARLFCPFIYVDQDISMVRGHLQGFPKKLGSVWMTRSYDLDHPAAARTGKGAPLGASLAVKDRRLAEASMQLTGKLSEPIGFFATPTFGLVGEPTIVGGPNSGRKRLVRQSVSERLTGPMHEAVGELQLFTSPRDELGELAPKKTVAANIVECALTVTGANEVAE